MRTIQTMTDNSNSASNITCDMRLPACSGRLLLTVVSFLISLTAIGFSISSYAAKESTSCELMGGVCMARTLADVSECRTDAHVADNRAVTWTQRNPKLAWHGLLCPEHLHCCIEDPCESILKGACTTSCDADGETFYLGFCPSPKWGATDRCCA